MVVRFYVEDDAGKKKDSEARIPLIVTVNKRCATDVILSVFRANLVDEFVLRSTPGADRCFLVILDL